MGRAARQHNGDQKHAAKAAEEHDDDTGKAETPGQDHHCRGTSALRIQVDGPPHSRDSATNRRDRGTAKLPTSEKS